MSYLWTAMEVNAANPLGVLIFMEFHRRLLPGFGKIPKPIRDDAFAMRGYCIDAPDKLPAGGCEWYEIGEGEGLPMQMEATR